MLTAADHTEIARHLFALTGLLVLADLALFAFTTRGRAGPALVETVPAAAPDTCQEPT